MFGEIEFVIIDELHMIMDESRGYQLESLIAKLRYLEKAKGTKVQIIAMSATMGGLAKLQTWLDTAIYQCDFRPVPLNEYYFTNGNLKVKNSDPNAQIVLDVKPLATF